MNRPVLRAREKLATDRKELLGRGLENEQVIAAVQAYAQGSLRGVRGKQ